MLLLAEERCTLSCSLFVLQGVGQFPRAETKKTKNGSTRGEEIFSTWQAFRPIIQWASW